MKIYRRTLQDLRVSRTDLFGEYSEYSFFDRHRHLIHPLTIYLMVSLGLLLGSVFLESGRYLLIVLYGLLAILGFSRSRIELAVRKLAVTHRPIKKVYREGDVVEVTIEVVNRSSLTHFGSFIEDHFTAASQPEVRLVIYRLESYSRMRLKYKATCDAGMGTKTLGPLKLTVSDPLGAFEYEMTCENNLEIEVLPRFQVIPELRTIPNGDSHHFGIYEVANRGASVSLAGIRNYDNGDSPRHISWRLSTRGRGLIVKDFEKSVNATVNIVLNFDPFWQLGSGADSTWEFAKDTALAIVSRHSQMGNFVSFVSGQTYVGPGSGENHVHEIALKVSALDFDPAQVDQSALMAEPSDLESGYFTKYETLFSRGSEVYYIVPFNEREYNYSGRALLRLAASGFRVNVVFIDSAAFWKRHVASIPAAYLMQVDLFARLPHITKELRSANIRVFLASPEFSLARTFQERGNPP